MTTGRLRDRRRASSRPPAWSPTPRPPVAYRGRRAARGGRRHRADGRPLRRRDRDGPGRGAPAQPARRPTPSRYTTPIGTDYDSGDYAEALDLVLAAAGYDDAAGRAGPAPGRGRPPAARHRPGRLRGDHRRRPAAEYGEVELRPDGTVLVLTGSTPYGQGHHTAWAMLVGDRLGIPIERIEVVHGDTDVVPRGGRAPAAPARCSWRARPCTTRPASWWSWPAERAADLLEAAVDDIVLDTDEGRFHVAGSPGHRSRDWAELGHRGEPTLAGRAAPTGRLARPPSRSGPTSPSSRSTPRPGAVDAGAAGRGRRRRRDPQPAAGRGPGARRPGPGRGPGPARGGPLRRRRQPADGHLRRLPGDLGRRAAHVRAASPWRRPRPLNPLGAKGIGESGTIGSTPAVHNAVIDALSHLGVRHLDMPTTPEKVWRAIQMH